jgi:hypothetical protein
MKRHYYISTDLDDLDHVEEELERAGVATPQMHVLSRDDAGVAMRPHLHPVEAVLKKDVVHGTEMGAVVGVVGAGLVLAVSYFSGVTETVGWVPFVFLAVIVLGFCTWEGGLLGIQEPHVDFVRFQEDLDAGRHIFFVDVDEEQEAALARIVADHPNLKASGEGTATPKIVVAAQKKFHDAMQTLP